MPDKLMKMTRAVPGPRPVMLAIAGDSAAGKTTLSRGLARALGEDRTTSICVDDYHRYDRAERRGLAFTPLHPDCNHIAIMEQHLQLLALGEPVLKPVYDHHDGILARPELIEPKEFVIIEGLLPLHTRLARACFDVTVYLDPPEHIRHAWKISRDTAERQYSTEQVTAELVRREPESAAFIRPQRAHADMVVRFGPIVGREDPPETPLSAELLLRPTIPHPDITQSIGDDTQRAVHCKLVRDADGRPVDAIHVHGHAPREECRLVEKTIWEALGREEPLPEGLGEVTPGVRTEPLALTQLLVLAHLLAAVS
ncbi:phosphoribulokinase [soil metagenome]